MVKRRNADRIVVPEPGRIVENDTRLELPGRNGIYTRLQTQSK